jgi:enamine deaminase RidA (YjgF/YER057c/UK114 family)
VPRFDLYIPSALPAPNGYSHAAGIAADSRLVWTSGQVALAPDGTLIGPGDWAAQTRAVMRNVATALAAGGAGWSDVFKLTIYVVDTAELATVRAVRDEFIDLNRPPTSSLVKVAGLFHPDLLIEVEAVAVADREATM